MKIGLIGKVGHMRTTRSVPTRIRASLISLRGPDRSWSYHTSGTPAAEPTAMAGLALQAMTAGSDDARAAAAWLGKEQRPDGSVGVSPALPTPGWATAHALWLWSALDGDGDRRKLAASWLLSQHGKTDPMAANSPVGHDTTIDGWPWAPRTHPWLEPTALAVLALRRDGYADHPRVREGLRLITNRAISTGGWNYGNTAVFNHSLRPQPGPTGIALLALVGTNPPSEVIERALTYLEGALPEIRHNGWSLGWACLALRAWGRGSSVSDELLIDASDRALARPNPALALATLLLASAEGANEVLYAKPPETRVL